MKQESVDLSPNADGFVYTDMTYDTVDKMVYPRDTHHVDINTAEYHPSTNSLIRDASPWLIYTPTPDFAKGPHLRFSYPILQNGVSANEVAEHFIPSIDIVDCGLNSETAVFELTLDASVWWKQEDWAAVSPPYFPLWLRLEQEVLVKDVKCACTVAKGLDVEWRRFALPLRAGESADIQRSGSECYFISLESDLVVGPKTISKKKIVPLSSPSVTVTSPEDTILLKVYR